jgi:hypothetical protein
MVELNEKGFNVCLRLRPFGMDDSSYTEQLQVPCHSECAGLMAQGDAPSNKHPLEVLAYQLVCKEIASDPTFHMEAWVELRRSQGMSTDPSDMFRAWVGLRTALGLPPVQARELQQLGAPEILPPARSLKAG